MATRIRTLNFLPEIFKTTTNSQFLQATLDQLVAQPNTKRTEGYIGSKFGYGINAKDYYVTEPTKVRTDYQLDPGVVFLKENDETAQDFISYPGIIDALKLEGAITNDNNRLFNSQFYSWDSFTNLDKLINFNQYYWIPEGLERVTVATDTVFNAASYVVTDAPNNYLIGITGEASAANPTITLLRGGTYTFSVNQNTQFWIQGAPGVTGYSPTQTNVQTRDVLGVVNNGASAGTVTFTVPAKDAQSEYTSLVGNNTVDLVSTIPYDEIDGQLVSTVGSIDGISSLNGLTVMFYDTGSTDISTSANFYTITYTGDPTDPTISLSVSSATPTNQKITVLYGTQWIARTFFRNVVGTNILVPYLSAELDTLYYQDGTTSSKVGVIKLIDSNTTNTIDVVTDILGKPNYTASNGVVFTNGLKVVFQGDIYPTSYKNVPYYVEGVGTAIQLIPESELLAPEAFTQGTYLPYDTTPYDVGNWDVTLYIPVTPDYITIARDSIDKNAWSRSNRWFHIDVINATAEYLNQPELVSVYATAENKAKRPIIEFYPNLRLFNSGAAGKPPVDFIDFRTTDAFSQVAGQTEYYPDVAAYTADNSTTIEGVSGTTSVSVTNTTSGSNIVTVSDTTGFFVNDMIEFTDDIGGLIAGDNYYIQSILDSTHITVSVDKNGDPVVLTTDAVSTSATVTTQSTTLTVTSTNLFGSLAVGQYITDSTGLLPTNSFVTSIDGTTTTTIIVSWNGVQTFGSTSSASIVTTDTTVDNYALFEGSRIVFAGDTNLNVRNKIYVSRFSSTNGSTPIITLTEAEDGQVFTNEQTVAFRGYNNQGKDFYFDGIDWIEAQQKTTVNQSPKFDIFDSNGISLGNREVYVGSDFTGCTLFNYGLGSGLDDIVLGFPVRYSSVDNIGDISFDVTLNSDVFNYVSGTSPMTENVNIGYVYSYVDRTTYVRQLGWQTTVSPSIQYQEFSFDWQVLSPTTSFTCDVAVVSSSTTNWPTVQVYINNEYQPSSNYVVTSTIDTTTVTMTVDSLIDTVVQVLILSDQVSKTAYYQIPTNLNNNPLNADVTVVDLGDVRGQYQSMFYNNPNTTGVVFGSNNFRDLGNMVPWGNRIVQNSASLVLPGAFLRKQNHNLFDALQYNSQRYITFKTLLVDTVNTSDYSVYLTPAEMLDDALDQMTASRTDSEPFFWTDMLPSKAAYITNTYSFANSLDVSIYPLSRIYDFATANYYGVLVYLTRTTDSVTTITQLVRNVDYTVSVDSPSLTIQTDLQPGDLITIKEYNQTYGSYAPSTPTKLGLYPASVPEVILDSQYSTPTYFIVGHDGSYNKLYGEYNTLTGQLQDFRDQVLLEYETRVYNNLKLSNVIPVQEYEVMPGYFRNTDYSYDEVTQIYSESFLNWVGQNRLEYKKQLYNKNNVYSYNYRNSGNKIDGAAIQQGNWRGMYQYFYDTSTPNTTPWEMLGLRDQPSWWESRYGAAPYTSDNLVLWEDLSLGINWNNGAPFVETQCIRDGLLDILPVDTAGNLVPPLTSIVGNYNSNVFRRDWQVGDVGPVEFSYRRSSSWPFDLMRILALTKPAEFFNLAVDVDHYKYSAEFNQYLLNNRSHLKMSDIDIYGNGTAVTSYINWIVDYEKQVGVDATAQIQSLLDTLDVRLVYRLAGFSDKNMLKFYVEKGTPNSRNASLLIPDESYSVLLYDNQPFTQLVYSSVIVQLSTTGYKVFGNSQTNAYFTIQKAKINGNYENMVIEGATARIPKDYYDSTEIVPYGTEFYTAQEVAVFLSSYGKYLDNQGMVFDQIENGIPIDWSQMVAEFLYWSQIGWEVGSIANINPAATQIQINKDSNIVQPLTLQKHNFVLNQNLYPIQSVDLNILREGTAFNVQPLNQGDTLAYGQFNLSNFEHGIVFDNTTLFGDKIYNLTTGLRQLRIAMRGTKTAEWNGTIDAQGFILNQDNITAWDKNIKYTRGSIVKYKNKYWTAITLVQAKELFDEREWKQTDYNEIQKGLLPNSQTRSYESTLYYNVDKPNLENDADLLSFSLIGYRPRDYLALADLTDITQINVYKNMIKEKGTLNAASAFKGATLAQGGIDYDIYENWAIKSGEFGGVLNSNFADMRLNESLLPGNPSIVSLVDGEDVTGSQQNIPLYSLYNYGRPINDPNILSTLPTTTPSVLLPDAGYANFNDVKMLSYYYSGMGNAVNQYNNLVPLQKLYVRDYVWLANYLQEWQILTPASLGAVTYAKNNLDGTVTLTFANAHNLSKYQIFAVVNFNDQVDGYYLVTAIVDPYKIVINLNLNPSIINYTGLGVGFSFQSNRVDTPADIVNLPLLNNEFTKNKVWVDTNTDGSWAVYRKNLNYTYNTEITKGASETFGSAVAYTDNMGYLISDASKGEVYRYRYNALTESYYLDQTLTGSSGFGTTIEYSGDLFAISEPAGSLRIYQLISTITQDEIELYQTITAPGGVTVWGNALAMSGDQNWLYVSSEDATVYVYRKSQVTGLYEEATTLTVAGLVSDDNFGASIATDYYGDTVVIGTPDKNYDSATENWGYTYVFNRTVQNVEVQYSSTIYTAQSFSLAWTPTTVTQTATATSSSNDRITVTSSAGFSVGDPVVFSGTLISAGAISENTVYYVYDKPTATTFRIASSRDAVAPIDLATDTGSMICTIQTTPLFVSRNGTLLADNGYAVIGSRIYMYSALNAGDIITVSSSNFVLEQTLTTENTPRIGVQFGQSVDTTKYGTEIIVGAPFELTTQLNEGAVYRYTNGGAKYGMVIGTNDCAVTTTRTLLINGFMVTLTAGNATTIAGGINAANITNITASASNGKLIISLINSDLATPNDKLTISVTNTDTLTELGFDIYTQTQTILCPHTEGRTQFGSVVKFNEFGSFIASAPVGARYSATTFDFTDDENIDNDTVFDNNATQWVDSFTNAGAVYMFDYLGKFNETLNDTGNFVYAQSVNDVNLTYGSQPNYGTALDFSTSHVVIGTSGFKPDTINGQVVSYINALGTADWAVYRNSAAIVDTDKIQNVQIYSASTNQTLDNLDYIDPLQGKLLGAVSQNVDFISNVDPATYNLPTAQRGLVWGADKVGQIWFNTSNVRFVNYHQDDVVYNSKWWGKIFPGSDVAVYTWVASNVQPINYSGPGVPFDVNSFAVEYTATSTGALNAIYYFWARNTNIVDSKLGKTLADSTIQSYIANPTGSGIAYMAPLLPNAFGLYNTAEYVNYTDSVLHIGFGTGSNDDVSHGQYSLIRANYADDFLPGLPDNNVIEVPESLYDRMLDSMCGVDEEGGVVPNPYLPKPVQSGVLARPRQSFFYNRFMALKNYLQYANVVLAQYPITEIRQASFLFRKGTENPSTFNNTNWSGPVELFFDTTEYWEYANWWATGYNNNTKSALQVAIYADLATLTVSVGTIVTVAENGSGSSETYILEADGSWTRIGLQNGTVQFKSSLWDYETARLGFGDNFFDTTPYDEYPSEDTRWIIRALNEEIYIDDLQIHRNKSLILLFEYIQSETIESQNYMPWLNKTSFIDVAHTIRELRPIEVFQSDNQDFLAGYLNEVKPYHVVIKEFLFKYTGTDIYEGDITDFDLPATYNTSIEQYVTPELVYSNPNGINQYLPTDSIWQQSQYSQWFTNQGISISGQPDYELTKTASYLAMNTASLAVDNASGFPINGLVQIGEELIAYSNVDRALNVISGLTRGVNGTTITTHLPGTPIIMDLPAVIVLNGGREYIEPPQVTAYIDTSIYPEPTVPAQLKAVMNLDSVLSIEVLNPGQGYAVLPEIVIEPATTIAFNSDAVNILFNTIVLYAPLLETGDIVRYTAGTDTTAIGGLVSGQLYYVNVLETVPSVVVALYTSYDDAVKDQNRVTLYTQGTGPDHKLGLGAVASCITSASPIRENNITLRFDRTSYTSQVTNWLSSEFYGSYYAGTYNNNDAVSSSSITLQDTRPPISTLLSSAQGIAFEITGVENDQLVTWSSRVRYVSLTEESNDSVRLIPQDGGTNPLDFEPNASGTTLGFYVGMPIKFIGAVVGNLVNDQVYYVAEIFNDIEFSVSETVNGSALALTDATVGAAGLACYVGEVTNTAVLTLDYPGISQVTATTATTNVLTVPRTLTGAGGTHGFYTGLSLFFTGTVFGNIVENEIYYVTSVIGEDEQQFTISRSNEPTQIDIYSTNSSTDAIASETTLGLAINDPVVFNNMTIAGESATSFGGIAQNTIYYVQSIVDGTHFTIATAINSVTPMALTTQASASGTGCTLTSQSDTVTLLTATGSMTMNINLPVSPGQINGQLFTMYGTSGQYVNPADTESNFLTRTVDITLATPDRVIVTESSGGILNVYTDMPIEFSADIGGYIAGTTYYVDTFGSTEVEVTDTVQTGNLLVCADTDIIYEDMPIIFAGDSLGGVLIGVTYFVKSIVSGTEFTISSIVGGSDYAVTNDTGSMNGTGEPYITLTVAVGSDEAGPVTMTQTPTTTAEFSVSSILGGYTALITNPGIGYAIDNTITILGTSLGGVTPDNDLVMTVNSVDVDGGITSLIRTGTPAGNENQYYFKVLSANTVAVYSNSLMNVPVSGIDFPYAGITSSTVTQTTASTDRFTVTSSVNFDINDAVVFTGTVFGGVELGQTYYVYDKPSSTTIRVSETVDGSVFALSDAIGQMSIAKQGDYALLPEPFYFNQSIVKYNNNVYRCIISNNDVEFIIGKWELLDSGNRVLNALDRIVGYYQPTVNMPGLDLTQLVNGITYPNSTYLGNAFAPADEFEVDTILQDQAFYPTEINVKAITWNGVTYLAPSDANAYSAVLLSEDGDTWSIDKIANQSLNVTDILYNGDKYVITTNNSATPILVSDDGITWITSGAYTPYSSTPYGETNFDVSSLSVASLSLNSVAYGLDKYIAVGENIVLSTDLYSWSEEFFFENTNSTNTLHGVAYVSIPNFTGFIAVGYSEDTEGSSQQNILLQSLDGYTWTRPTTTLTSYSFNAVTSSSTTILVVGDNSVRYTSFNGSNWINASAVSGENLNDAIFANSLFVVVGDNGTIETSTNGTTWTTRTSGTTENLNGITWNADDSVFVVVGDNNTILKSSNGTTWVSSSLFTQDPTIYNVQGESFASGYGPEEMVPGVVTDSLTMIVATRPGTNWEETVYQHVGYNVVSVVLDPLGSTATTYSFADVVQTPAQVTAYIIDGTTNLCTTIYPDIDYTIDWVNEEVNLTTPMALTEKLRIDVYEVGNGNQLVKANTQTDPIQYNSVTGFNEIVVNCNYTAPIYSGSGVVRPGSESHEVIVTETIADSNSLVVASIVDFVVNDPIYFQGAVFGNITEDTVYYVKTISAATGSITISASYNVSTGTAGPTFELVDATGEMLAIIQYGSGTPWTDPIMYHNGTKLVSGVLSTVTRTKSGTNTITCNNTSSLIVDTPIRFSETMFGTDITPLTTYYIKAIVDSNEFTISETPGGSTKTLSNATGGATLITNDYAFAIASNGVSAKIVLAENYDVTVDYLTYTLFGQTNTNEAGVQYGYTIPETQYFTGTGSDDTFDLTNFNGGDNPTNAIVEVAGLRLTSSEYSISDMLDQIVFTTAPTLGDTIAVTTFNDTERQYLNTQYGITGASVSQIASINNTLSAPIVIGTATATTSGTNRITTSSTADFVIGQTIQFKGTSFGDIETDGTVYFVKTIVSGTQFTVATSPDLSTTLTVSTDTGIIAYYVGGQGAVRVTTSLDNNLSTNDIVRIDGTSGSVQLNNNTYYVHKISDTQFDLYTSEYDPAYGASNSPVTSISSYISGGYVWLSGLFTLVTTTATATAASDDYITVSSTNKLVVDTPVIFTESGKVVGDTTLGGLVIGTIYYVKEISTITKFSVSATHGGDVLSLTTSTGTMNVTQWEQDNVDRLWVTINGYRVPSGSLRLNPANDLTILAAITSTDEVIITSMMPSATPNEEVFMLNVNAAGQGSAYRANTMTRTWLTSPILNTSTTISVFDASRLTDTSIQTSTVGAEVDGIYTVGISSDKNLISQVTVFNNTTGLEVSSVNYDLVIIDTAPVIQFNAGVSEGDSLTITVILGNLIFVNGEQIRFGSVNLETNTLSDLQRGINGTGIQAYIPEYAEVYGILSTNRMSDVDYRTVWNSSVYNTTLGDPLQISLTDAAVFLNTDIT